MSTKVTDYIAGIADLDQREAAPGGISMPDEVAAMDCLTELWVSMSDGEQEACEILLKQARLANGT